MGSHVVTEMGQANAFGVLSVAQAGQRVTWHARLRGCLVFNAAALLEKGACVPWIQYKGIATDDQCRHVYLTTNFVKQHDLLANLLRSANERSQKWRLYDTWLHERESCRADLALCQ